MLRNTQYLANEDGSVLIIALLMLAFLSLLGISSTNTATIEVQIAGNERNFKQNFYKAEAGAMEAALTLENENDETVLLNHQRDWLHNNNVMTDVTNWDYDGVGGDDNAVTADDDIDPDNTTYFTVVDLGIAPGGSLTMGGTNLHEYAIYGLYKSTDGQSLVEVGYRKRF